MKPWIVVDFNRGVFLCTRCDTAEALKLPAPISAFVLRSKAFTNEHKRCAAAPPQAKKRTPARATRRSTRADGGVI